MVAESTSRVLSAKVNISPGSVEAALRSLRIGHPRLTIQIASLERLPGRQTVVMIGEQTVRAKRTGALLAAKPEVDLLLRLAGTNQIAAAIEKVGYGSGGEMLLVAVGSPREVARLGKQLVADTGYETLEDREAGEWELALVEAAALLGARS